MNDQVKGGIYECRIYGNATEGCNVASINVDAIVAKLSIQMAELKHKEQKHTRLVAFNALSNIIENAQDNDNMNVVNFDEILYNEGEGFNKITRKFRAPVSGTYYLALYIMKIEARNIHLTKGSTIQ